jgi:hypothetical protein
VSVCPERVERGRGVWALVSGTDVLEKKESFIVLDLRSVGFVKRDGWPERSAEEVRSTDEQAMSRRDDEERADSCHKRTQRPLRARFHS